MQAPLAERMRPRTLDDYIAQDHLVGDEGSLRAQISSGRLSSLILWGPPGTGKTTLAQIIAQTSDRQFIELSAINSGVKDVREAIDKASKSSGLFTTSNPILFIDEIHRFSKSQQDSLLHAVERGIITLIGATTENPSFEVIPALLSRCQVYVLQSFTQENLLAILQRALEHDVLLHQRNIQLSETDALLRASGGDGRKLLNTLELVCNMYNEDPLIINNDMVSKVVQVNASRYDKTGEQHYDIASALIKSIRGTDPNGAVYWLARMIEGGEDVKFIARRLVIAASEDIGLANPNALILATNTFQAVSLIGYPESRILLSQCAIYLATSPKSNASYMAINKAQQTVRQSGDLSVPLHLRNAPTKLMKQLGYGKEYVYSHNDPANQQNQEFLPDELSGTVFYEPGYNKREQGIKSALAQTWKDRYDYNE